MRLEIRITLWLTVLLGAAAALTLLGMTKVEQQNLAEASKATAWVSSTGQQTLDQGRRAALLASMNTARTVTSEADGTLSVFVPVRMQAECGGCHAQGQD